MNNFNWLQETAGTYIHPDLYVCPVWEWLTEVAGVFAG